MKDLIIYLFEQNSSLIVFLHILSAIVWVGGMIALRFAVHFAMQHITDPKLKLQVTLDYLKRFFRLVIPAIVILVITAGWMAIGLQFKGTPLYTIIHIKEVIWSIMVVIFIYINIQRSKSESYFKQGDLKSTKQTLTPIANLFIPINIALGLIALYLGITLRGF